MNPNSFYKRLFHSMDYSLSFKLLQMDNKTPFVCSNYFQMITRTDLEAKTSNQTPDQTPDLQGDEDEITGEEKLDCFDKYVNLSEIDHIDSSISLPEQSININYNVHFDGHTNI